MRHPWAGRSRRLRCPGRQSPRASRGQRCHRSGFRSPGCAPSGGRHLLTVKTPVVNELSCVEHETEVADRQQMDAALRQMGFYPTVRIRKFRRTAVLGPMSLCLDEVDGLGAFLEIEQIVAAGEQGGRVQADLDRFAATLGVSLERITDTYDSLIRAAQAGV
ncbi:class IV adenylate cyclase [Micromonospora sp. WMMA1923]|uniref:class IV adenylate cyclase n=1 Tax=Micromonospora sp. WMMA1923 TaxID=3404125 RepID=UPI003B94C7EA